MIGHGLDVISKRLSEPEQLRSAFEELTALYEPLSSDFAEFYPLLERFARLRLAEMQGAFILGRERRLE